MHAAKIRMAVYENFIVTSHTFDLAAILPKNLRRFYSPRRHREHRGYSFFAKPGDADLAKDAQPFGQPAVGVIGGHHTFIDILQHA